MIIWTWVWVCPSSVQTPEFSIAYPPSLLAGHLSLSLQTAEVSIASPSTRQEVFSNRKPVHIEKYIHNMTVTRMARHQVTRMYGSTSINAEMALRRCRESREPVRGATEWQASWCYWQRATACMEPKLDCNFNMYHAVSKGLSRCNKMFIYCTFKYQSAQCTERVLSFELQLQVHWIRARATNHESML